MANLDWKAFVGHVFVLVSSVTSQARPPPPQNLVSTARTSGSHDPGVLTLAVICVRNCVKRHWSQRSRTSTVVPAAEKPGLRSLILALIGECEGPLNGQLCLLAAAVGRCDWPRDWPELFPTIVAGTIPCSFCF